MNSQRNKQATCSYLPGIGRALIIAGFLMCKDNPEGSLLLFYFIFFFSGWLRAGAAGTVPRSVARDACA